MRLLMLVIVLAALGVGGYFAYVKFVKKEDVKLEVPKVDVNVDVDPWTAAEAAYHTFQYDKAIENYRKVIDLNKDPKQVEQAHFRIAAAYSKSKRPEEAIKAYEFALRTYPRSESASKAKQDLEKLKLQR